jgi:single-strand DNA-binding protein
MNRYELIGNLGKDPEIRIAGDKKVASFSVATSMGDATEWHNVEVWDKIAELAEKYLKKGSKVFVSGMHKTRSYEGKDGQKRYTSVLSGRELIFLDSKGTEGEQKKEIEVKSKTYESKPITEELGDDLPF